jgi:hypothetical protein
VNFCLAAATNRIACGLENLLAYIAMPGEWGEGGVGEGGRGGCTHILKETVACALFVGTPE